MNRCIALVVLLILASCGVQASIAEPLGYIAPVCGEGSNHQNSEKDYVTSEYLRSKISDEKLCVQDSSPRVLVSSPLRIIPYKNGMVDVELACNKDDSRKFFRGNAGSEVVFLAGGKAVIKARIPENPTTDRCAILAQESLDDSVALCEAFADSLKKDRAQCLQLCTGSDKEWACVVHK
ncbi:hypothetical protein ACM9XC_05135 [Xanthomonas sacchari]